jgi:hemerythrin-like domain-containing protein
MHTICDYLTDDHKRCEALFVQVGTDVMQRDWQAAGTGFAQFRSMLTAHIEMEESYLFPAFEKAMQDCGGPLAIMRRDHQHLRGLVDRMDLALQRQEATDFALHAESYTILIRQHSMMEEEMLYPLLDRAMAGGAARLVDAMREARAADPAPLMPPAPDTPHPHR